MTVRPTPAAAPPAAGRVGLPAVPPAGRPAIMPLYPRGDGSHNVCAVIRGGALSFIIRDVLEAIEADLGEYALDRSHDAPTSYAEHATAHTWTRAEIEVALGRPALRTNPAIPGFLRWLDERVADLEQVGLDTIERTTSFGTGHRPAAPTPAVPSVSTLPQYYSVAATARILSRDPGIGIIGRDALFEQLHKLAWVNRIADSWKPHRELILLGFLLTQHVTVPARTNAYPQVLITPAGIESLHTRLGGTATLTLAPSDHLTLIEATR